MARKRVYTTDELANDPSLFHTDYKPFEVVHSDHHKDLRRFVRYEDGEIVLASLGGMAELPKRVPILSVRRLSSAARPPLSEAEKGAISARQKLSSRLRKKG